MKKYYFTPILLLVLGISCTKAQESQESDAQKSVLEEIPEEKYLGPKIVSKTIEIDVPLRPIPDAGEAVEGAALPPLIPVQPGPPPPPIFIPTPFPAPIFNEHRFVERSDDEDHDCDGESCVLGVAGFATDPQGWYPVDAPVYPGATLLSKNRNYGYVRSNVVLNPEGLTVNEAGTYWVNFEAILTNLNTEHSVLANVYLVPNNTFDPDNFTTQIGGVVLLPMAHDISPTPETVQGNGILLDLEPNTTLSLMINNGSSVEAETITVISWVMNIQKICD